MAGSNLREDLFGGDDLIGVRVEFVVGRRDFFDQPALDDLVSLLESAEAGANTLAGRA